MPPITPADTLACLKQAFADFTNRWGKRKPPTIVADFGALLFEQRIADAEAAVKGENKPVTIFRVSTVVDTLDNRHKRDLKGSFSGNNSMQRDLAGKLDDLPSYPASGGTLLRVTGPEHKVGTEMHLYLDVVAVEHAAATTSEPAIRRRAIPEDEAELVAAYKRDVPARERKQIREGVKKGARGRVMRGRGRSGKQRVIIFFLPLLLGAAALYYAVHRDFDMNAQAVMEPNWKSVVVVRWSPPSGIYGPYIVIKNGVDYAKRDTPFFVDEHPRRDEYPGVERLSDVYRIKGYLWHIWPVVTTSKPPEDRLWPNEPCIVRDQPTLCIAANDLDYWLRMPFAEFIKPAKFCGILGEEQVVNAGRHVIERDGERVRPDKDISITHPARPGQPNTSGATESMVFRWDKPGPVRLAYRNTDNGQIESESVIEVLTLAQVRAMAAKRLPLKKVLYARKDIAPFIVDDGRADVAITNVFPLRMKADGQLVLPQLAAAYTQSTACEVSLVIYSSLSMEPENASVQIDYGDQDTDRELLRPGRVIAVKGRLVAMTDFTYRPREGESYPLKRTVSAWIYAIDEEGQMKLHEIIRKELGIPAIPGGPACAYVTRPVHGHFAQ